MDFDEIFRVGVTQYKKFFKPVLGAQGTLGLGLGPIIGFFSKPISSYSFYPILMKYGLKDTLA